MDRASYAQRAGPGPRPTMDQRLANLEMFARAVKGFLQGWTKDHKEEEARWRETHAAAHEALQDHVYALDQKIRRIE